MTKKVSQFAYFLILAIFLCLIFLMVFRMPNLTTVSVRNLSDPQAAPVSDALTDGKININTADAETLALLNGIGNLTAARIVDYRKDHGPFNKIDDLDNVKGIGSATLKQIRNYITVGG